MVKYVVRTLLARFPKVQQLLGSEYTYLTKRMNTRQHPRQYDTMTAVDMPPGLTMLSLTNLTTVDHLPPISGTSTCWPLTHTPPLLRRPPLLPVMTQATLLYVLELSLTRLAYSPLVGQAKHDWILIPRLWPNVWRLQPCHSSSQKAQIWAKNKRKGFACSFIIFFESVYVFFF